VHALLTWSGSGFTPPNQFRNVQLTIFHKTRKIGDYRPPPLDGARVGWGPLSEKGGPLRVMDLDGDGRLEVIVDLFSGGAHCCVYSDVYRYVGGRYVSAQKDFASAGYVLRKLRGTWQFVGRDSSFDYAFTAYAFSLDPIRIWHYAHGVFTDVTRTFPLQVAADAGSLMRLYRKTLRGPAPRDVRGILAAYTADECLLNRCNLGFAVVGRAHTAGQLGPHYIAALRVFLRRHGYLH
jgi:hypothetical protein